jgi:hypothetical protein
MHHQLIKKGHEDRIKKTTFEALSRDFWNRIKIYDVKIGNGTSLYKTTSMKNFDINEDPHDAIIH